MSDMKPKTLTLLILAAIVMASVACEVVFDATYQIQDKVSERVKIKGVVDDIEPDIVTISSTPTIKPTNSLFQDLQQQQQAAHLLFDKATNLLNTGSNERAIEVLNQAIQLWPDYRMYWHRGVAHYRVGTAYSTSDLEQVKKAVFHFNQSCNDYNSALLNKHQISEPDLTILNENKKACEGNLQQAQRLLE